MMTEDLSVSRSRLAEPLPGISIAPVIRDLLQTAGYTLATDRTSAKQLIDQAIELLNTFPMRATPPSGCFAPCCGLAPWQMRRVSDFIEKHLASSLPAARLAGVVDLSTGYFCHAFRKSFGVPPHTYVMGKRVQRAQSMMLTTDDPLSQIALSCGLADQSHLSRVFRRALGSSPSAWRRHYKISHSSPRAPGFEFQADALSVPERL
jgi:AraC family transcriptional regulator